MNTKRKEAVEDALSRGLTEKEAFAIAINTPDYSLADLWGPDDSERQRNQDGKGRIHAFVDYQDARLGPVTGSTLVHWDDLAKMPHTISISATRPRSFHIKLTGYVDHFGPVNGGWPAIVNRYWKQMPEQAAN